jgi:hypothetical protein
MAMKNDPNNNNINLFTHTQRERERERDTNRIRNTPSQIFEDLNSTLNSLKRKWNKLRWQTWNERVRKKEQERETLSCWGEVERPLPWMPTSASMSEFSDSVIDSCSTWEHRNTKLLLRNFEGLGETKVEREHDDESNPILLFTFTTLRVRAIVVNVTC